MTRKTSFRTAPLWTGLLLALTALLAAACIAPVEAPAGSESGGGDLTVEQLRNATYSGIYDEPVTLTDGRYEGEPFVEGGAARPTVDLIDWPLLFGDLDGDGADDAVVLLVENSGGSGVFSYMGAQLNQQGSPVDAGTVLIGDRTQIKSASLADGKVVLEIITPGPDDPMCCGTLKVRKTLALQDEMLTEVGAEELGNVALADLMGTSWVLTSLGAEQPVLPDTEITAEFMDDAVAGSAGCNRYNAGLSSDGGQNLTVGPAISTQMACPEPILDQEFAYLTALQGATQWSYFNGGLAIVYQTEDGGIDSLQFMPAPAADETTSSEEFVFLCADDVTITVVYNQAADTALVTLPDGQVELPIAVSASGARYSDGNITFWNKGDEALVEIDGEMVYTDCLLQSE